MRTDAVVGAARSAGPDPAGRGRTLVVVGGLPGAGKTTLLRRLLAQRPAGVVGLDSEDVAARLTAAAGGLPYRALRPLVHVVHRVRVVAMTLGGAPVVVLTDPWTSPWWRAVVTAAARRAGRSVRLLLLDAPQDAAEDGQAARGRVVPERSMRRHAARWARLLRRLDADRDVDPGADRDVNPGADPSTILRVDRAGARRLTLDGVLRGRPDDPPPA
ncbi:ATP-binding protein [Geodermatophilus sp. YIM 151500]|uniref:ATP-binding protein n=1 Tax=Geodermatophilus sp. YIM 151500 TaxID=2984531 RepID=UPI0021E450E4|nr:ATP-binding protein [Geodermatophilus sp. YIM 151500]MCV2489891.1 ATP-binding protein [Geodermatophilus sp. YIM 151500]